MAKVYYIGDWAVQLGPVYAETSFNHVPKGLDLINYGKWLVGAVESSGRHEIVSVPTWDFYNMPPGEYEKILEEYDIIVFSDVEAKNFQLHPQFFNRHLFGTKVLTFPDRIRLMVEALHAGTHMMFLGGWLSFNGEMGKGGWGRTPLHGILPCECLEVEDLRESTEGVVNLPTSALLDKVLACGKVSGRDVRDKFAMTGLTPLPAQKVKPPLIAECPVNLECRLLEDPEPVGDHDLFKGEVLVEHVDADLVD